MNTSRIPTPGPKAKITAYLPVEMVAKVKEIAKHGGIRRSYLVEEAIRRLIEQIEGKDEVDAGV